MGNHTARSRKQTLGAVTLILALAMTLGCQREPAPEEKDGSVLSATTSRTVDLTGANVIVITMDTTRADHIGAYGYEHAETPHLDQLAAEGALFEEAVTPTAFTLPSHSSILTGLYPPFHGVRLNGGSALADVHTTMAESLSDAGYRCGAVTAAFVVDGHWGLNQGFDFYDDDIAMEPDQQLDLAGVQRRGDRIVDLGLEWLGEPDPRPFFTWLHFYDPHIGYDPPEPYRSRFEGRGRVGLYDGEIAFTDAQIGRVLDWLDDRGIADDTVVVVVGDHGESLGDHGEREHGYYIYDATVHVPLIIRAPGAGVINTRVPGPVRTIDVMPTVLDLVGVDVPEAVQGQSLVPLMLDPNAPGPETAYAESMSVHLQYGWAALYSLRTATHKYIDAPRPELYDLFSDAGENHNQLADDPDLGAEMADRLARLRDEIEAGAPEAQEADLDEETMGMLAVLGYVGGASAAPEGENLADPKDKLHIFESVGYASHLLTGDEIDEAVDVLEKVVKDDPAVPQARLMLASAYKKIGRNEDAKALLDPFLRENPDNTVALIAMATILSEEGRDDEVLALTQRVLSVNDHNTQAYELMAGVHMKANDHSAAVPLLEKAVDLQPKLTRPKINLAAAKIALSDLGEAEQLLLEIIDHKPEFPLAHFHLGLLYEEQRRFAEAETQYKTEIAIHDTALRAWFNLGNLYFGLGDYPAAETEMRILIEKAPETAKPYLLLGRTLLKQEKDFPDVERFTKIGIENTDAAKLKVLGYYILADVYSRQGRKAELNQVLERAEYYRAQVEGS